VNHTTIILLVLPKEVIRKSTGVLALVGNRPPLSATTTFAAAITGVTVPGQIKNHAGRLQPDTGAPDAHAQVAFFC